jgi:hypothetical protein
VEDNVDQIDSLLRKPKAYYNIDGVGELGIGFMCLGYALLGWMQVRSPEHSAWNTMYALVIYFGAMIAVIHYGSKAIKEHITYPRTGFVEYRRTGQWLTMALTCGFSAMVAAVMAMGMRAHWNLTTPASLVGLIFAASYAYGFDKSVRWKWTVVVTMAAGSLAIALLPANLVGAIAVHSWITRMCSAQAYGAFWLSMALYGAVISISGGISFWLYLRRTQPAARDAE